MWVGRWVQPIKKICMSWPRASTSLCTPRSGDQTQALPTYSSYSVLCGYTARLVRECWVIVTGHRDIYRSAQRSLELDPQPMQNWAQLKTWHDRKNGSDAHSNENTSEKNKDIIKLQDAHMLERHRFHQELL